jgi:hypothetical protein
MEADQPRPGRKKVKRFLKITIGLVIALGFTWLGVTYYQMSNEVKRLRAASPPAAGRESAVLIQKVSALMDLPDENPTIATVEDAKKLASQVFFKKAKNGDKVLMYPKTKKAILYRPSADRIIEVAYLNIETESRD